MSKTKSYAPASSQQDEEMSVVVLKFKGSGETLRRGMDTVAQALAALGGAPTQTTIRHVNGRKASQLSPPAAEAIDANGAATEIDDEHIEESDDDSEGQERDATSPKAPAAPRKFKFLSEVGQ